MATLIFRKVLGDLARNKARTLLAVLSIAAGVFAVGLAFGALGVLRAIGTTATGIVEVFCGEGILLGVLSWLFALPLSYPAARVFSDAVGNAAFGTPLDFHYSVTGVILWLAIVLVLSALVVCGRRWEQPKSACEKCWRTSEHVHTVQSHKHTNREEKDGTISVFEHGMD
jgi:hypothetical protein